MFEFLSHNFGLYFVAHTMNNPGSGDMVEVIDSCEQVVEKGVDEATQNLARVRERLNAMLYTRLAVFNWVRVQLPNLTPYEWLLLQLHPTEFFGANVDVFKALTLEEITRQCDLRVLSDSLLGLARARGSPFQRQYCFVDEAQVLTDKLVGSFETNYNDRTNRSLYSAVVKGLAAQARHDVVFFAVMSGTGLSISALKEETASNSAKEPIKVYAWSFSKFRGLSEDGVKAYLDIFVDFGAAVKDDVIRHVARWLCGRPRWSATFFGQWMSRPGESTGTRRSRAFEQAETAVIRVLEDFIAVMTTGKQPKTSEADEARMSWSLDRASVFASIERLYSRSSGPRHTSDLRTTFRDAACAFSLNGRDQVIRRAPLGTCRRKPCTGRRRACIRQLQMILHGICLGCRCIDHSTGRTFSWASSRRTSRLERTYASSARRTGTETTRTRVTLVAAGEHVRAVVVQEDLRDGPPRLQVSCFTTHTSLPPPHTSAGWECRHG